MENIIEYQPQFMIVPSLSCPANCYYCFGPNKGPKMSKDIMEKTINFMSRIIKETNQKKVKITFHGGEPLAAGYSYFEDILGGLHDTFQDKKIELNIQSNLWLLNVDFCELFYKNKVSLGTSLDGPEEITDSQRGEGYYKRTMKGINLAKEYGLDLGCIATFTEKSAQNWKEIFDFFIDQRINFSVHSAVPSLENRKSEYVLSPENEGSLLYDMLEYYIERRKEISISTLDQMCHSVLNGEGHICTFRDCLGMFLAIDPMGNIYPCQRFCGRKDYIMGNVIQSPDIDTLFNSPVAKKMEEREDNIKLECKECSHLEYCKGGCTYNAWANGKDIDPYCESYKKVFDFVKDRLVQEMSSEENIEAIAKNPFPEKGHFLLRKGPLTELACNGTHPTQIARNAKRIVAAVELARGPDLNSVAERLVKMKISRNLETASSSLENLQRNLHPKNTNLNNLYLHTTFSCQLKCTHCYANADNYNNEEMPTHAMEKLINEAKCIGFRQVIITGGEPLIHSDRSSIFDMLIKIHNEIRPMNLVLRTNFAMKFDEDEIYNIGRAFDQVVVSIDGNEETHDARRGKDKYKASVNNIEIYQRLTKNIPDMAELSVATVMSASDIQGEPGFSVRKLARELNIKRTRFRPLLPIGRAKDWDEPPVSEALGSYLDPMEMIENGFNPCSSCGMGQNLYIEPLGESFPCYAYHEPHSYIGNVIEKGLNCVIESEKFKDLSRHNVDTNIKCKECEYKYLCGGACRAWGGQLTLYNLDAPPPECERLKKRAKNLYESAYTYLDLNKKKC